MRGERRPDARERRRRETGGARLGVQRDQPRRGGRGPRVRHVPGDARRGAVGPRDGRAVGHPVAAVDPARARHGGAEGAVPAARVREASGAMPTRSPRSDAGSDPSMVRTTTARRATATAGCCDGEKWHVTSRRRRGLLPGARARRRRSGEGHGLPGRQGHARACGWCGRRSTPTRSCSSIRSSRSTACASARTRVLGEVGQGFELTKDWFVEERLMIGARTMGASARALELSLAFAQGREQFGTADRRVPGDRVHARRHGGRDHGGEVDAVPRVLEAARGGHRPQAAARAGVRGEARCAARRPDASIDRAVQIFGGRGYMREQPVERHVAGAPGGPDLGGHLGDPAAS